DPAKANHVAHEVGHLLGLADDYDASIIEDPVTKKKKRISKPLAGREHTLMADGGPIDANLIQRLVVLIRDVTHQVPDCKPQPTCPPPDSWTFDRMRWGKWRGQVTKDDAVNHPLPYLCSM